MCKAARIFLPWLCIPLAVLALPLWCGLWLSWLRLTALALAAAMALALAAALAPAAHVPMDMLDYKLGVQAPVAVL